MRRATLIALASSLALALTGQAESAYASTPVPQWTVTAVSDPTSLVPGDETGDQLYRVIVTNTGSAESDGSPVVVSDSLPQGVDFDPLGASGYDLMSGKQLLCSYLTCTYSGKIVPEDRLVVSFPIDVEATAVGSVTNMARVHGGGAIDAAASTTTTISSTPAGFGIASGSAAVALSSTQAGDHADLTTALSFNTVRRGTAFVLAGDEKETVADLPPGFAGDLVDTPACSAGLFSVQQCPVSSQVGITNLTIVIEGREEIITAPVYNLSPDPGEVAKIGFRAKIFNVEGDVTLRPDYGLRTTFSNITETAAELIGASLTIWGVPGDAIHDPWRWDPHANKGFGGYGVSSDGVLAPFFTNPTACTEQPAQATLGGSSWQQPATLLAKIVTISSFDHCDSLGFPAKFIVRPTTTSAYSPTGLDVRLEAHQTYDNPYGLATSTLDEAVVELPEGMTINPSAGVGLSACSPAQYESASIMGDGCPPESKLGTVKISTPSLKEEATGGVYVAQPFNNPFHSLIALYIIASIPDRGVLVKSAGIVAPDPLTGRLVTTFANLPPLPFTSFLLSFRQGATSPLVSPPNCGQYSASTVLTPLASPTHALSALMAPPFEISSAFDGGPCPGGGGAPPLHSQVIAGTENNNAGVYTPFYLRIVRSDGEQELTRFSTVLPPGLTGNLTGIPFCPDAAIQHAREATGQQEIHEPSCPAASEIGHTLVGAGVGSVLAWTPGKIYLAGPYHGSALSIVSVTSATVGPFDLGTVVIRFALKINPITGQAEIDGSSSDPIPHIIDGIVVHVRDIHAYIDRPRFMLNPTNCDPKTISNAITGAGADIASSADDQTVSVETRFQAADCANLAFKPSFAVTTSGKTSRKNGASLHVKLTYPSAPLGSQANIRYVKVDLPRQLPSRLETIQKACPDHVFEANPAACPRASLVGTATTTTPIVPVPLSGPAYFVSHGARAFPDLIVVLQGYGITIDLRGETFIAKSGQTSTTFRTIPDEPVGTFEMTLPEGPYSALAAPTGVCSVTKTVLVSKRVRVHGRAIARKVRKTVAAPLAMPTRMIAQNGAVFTQNTKINTVGCPKAKKKSSKHGKGKRKK